MAKPVFEVIEGPEADALIEKMRAGRRSSNYLHLNHDRLLELYPEEWVAVLGEEVVAHDPSYEVVLKRYLELDNTGSGKIEFLTRNPPVLILIFG